MSVEQTKVIDSVNQTKDSKEILLPIFDHLDWEGDRKEHMYLLQEKVKTYLDYVESGQLKEMSPEHAEKPVTIQIIAKYDLPKDETINKFFAYLKKMVSDEGLKFDFSVSDES